MGNGSRIPLKKHAPALILLSFTGILYFDEVFVDLGYPPQDSSFMAISVVFLLILIIKLGDSLLRVFGVKKSNSEDITLLTAFVLGMIALQAAWPIFMPRISLEDTNQLSGVVYADKNQYQIVQEAVVKVKPPLFPFVMSRNYPIADNLTAVYKYHSSNLDIVDSNNKEISKLR